MRKHSRPKRARGSGLALCLWMLGLTGCGLFDSGTDAEHLAKARTLHQREELSASIIELKNALQKNPDNGEARALLGRIQVELGQGAAAEKELRRAIELQGSRPGLSGLLAEALHLQGKYRELLTDIVPATSQPPEEQARLYARRGDAWLALGKPEQARGEYEQALRSDPDAAPGQLGLARLAALDGQFEEARRLTAEALAADPKEPSAWSFQAGLQESAGELDKAEASYTQAMALRRLNQGDRAGRALVRITLDKLEDARQDIGVLKRDAPNHYLTYYADGLLHLRQGQPAEAQVALETAERLNDRFALTQYQLGLAHLRQDHLAQAEQHLSRFLRAAPKSLGGIELMALIKLRQGDFASVKQLLAPVLQSRPENIAALRLMGEAELGLGKLQNGIDHLQKAVTLDPKSAATRQGLALGLLSQGETAKGLAELQAAAELNPGSAQPDIWIALVHTREREFDQALLAIEKVRTRSPDSGIADRLLGTLRLAQDDLPAARRAFEQALARQPGDPAVSHQLAQLALREGRPEEARRIYEAVLKAAPGDLATEIELARLEVRAGQFGAMAERMDAAIKAHPDALQPRLIRAEYLLRLGQPDRAQVLLEQIQRHYPQHPDLLGLLVQAQLDNGQTRLALNTAEALAGAAPQSARAHYLLALAQGSNGNARHMRRALNRALALDPAFVPARQAEIRALALDGKYPEAEERLKRLLDEYPDDPDALGLKGWYASLRGKPEEAVQAYRAVVAKAPGTRTATQLAQAQWQAGDRAGAIRSLEDWIASHPGDGLSRYLLAGLYRETGRPMEAQGQLRKVLDINPRNILAMNDLAWLLRTAEPKRALELAEQAAQTAPNSPEILDTLGTVLLEQGQDPCAVEVLRRAVELAPGNPSLAYRLALALSRTGQTGASLKAVKGVLSDGRAFPERREAVDLLKKMTAQAGG